MIVRRVLMVCDPFDRYSVAQRGGVHDIRVLGREQRLLCLAGQGFDTLTPATTSRGPTRTRATGASGRRGIAARRISGCRRVDRRADAVVDVGRGAQDWPFRHGFDNAFANNVRVSQRVRLHATWWRADNAFRMRDSTIRSACGKRSAGLSRTRDGVSRQPRPHAPPQLTRSRSHPGQRSPASSPRRVTVCRDVSVEDAVPGRVRR